MPVIDESIIRIDEASLRRLQNCFILLERVDLSKYLPKKPLVEMNVRSSSRRSTRIASNKENESPLQIHVIYSFELHLKF